MRYLPLLLTLWVTPLFARWMTVEEAGSVIETYHIEYDVEKSGAFTQTTDYTVRVQGEDAKTSASLFPIEYNAMTDKVEIIEAYTQNGKDKVKVDSSAIEDRDKGESKDYDAMKVRSVVFPQVQIGSRLHIKFIMHSAKSMIDDRWSNDITLAPGMFVEHFRVHVKSATPIYFEARDPRGLISVKQPSKTSLEITNKKNLPGWVHAEKEPFFHPDGFSEVWMSTEREWPVFFAGFEKEFNAVVGAPVPRPLKAWVASAARLKDPRAQIYFLMDRMSHEFRYFGDWRRHNGGIVPRPLTEIEGSRYGDCKDLASLLTALLRGVGLEANVALVRRGENAWGYEPDYKLPAMTRFNHAIVQAKFSEGGRTETVWLDATNPVSSLSPFPDIAGRPAWVLKPGAGHFDRLPEAVSQDFVHVHEYEYRFKSADLVKVKVNAQLKKMAPYHIASELLMESRSEVLSDTLEYFTEGQELRSFRYLKEPSTTRTLADMNVSLEYDAGRITFDAGKAGFFVIPDGFLSGPFYETEERESDLRLSEEPFLFTGIRRLKDAKLMQSKPDPCSVKSEWMDLTRRIAVEGNDVVIYQTVDLRKPFVTRHEFRSPAFRQLTKEQPRVFLSLRNPG